MSNMALSEKQNDVLQCYLNEQPKILITSGAKRAGKTFIQIILFMQHISSYDEKGLKFIVGGANQAAIRRNVLDDIELIIGREIKLDENRSFRLFNQTVYVFDGQTSDAWKKARGFTAAGAFLNEGTALHDKFVKEVISRCSYKDSKVFIDTNPEDPQHTVKTDYIDKSGARLKNGRLNIKAFNFTLFDNNALDPEYVESIVQSTPDGMYMDRDVYGRWVAPEGVVYRNFNQEVHYVDEVDMSSMVNVFAAVDWGYEHFGAIVVIAESKDSKFYLIEEHAYQHKEIDEWVDIAKGIRERYGRIPYFCDSARPEYVARFRKEKFKAINADKSVISGIEEVARLYKQERLFILRSTAKRFKDEINSYVWDSKSGMPVKQMDDVQDAIRYAIYTFMKPRRLKGDPMKR